MTTVDVWGKDTFRLVAHCCPKNKDFVRIFFGRIFVSVFNKSLARSKSLPRKRKFPSDELWMEFLADQF